MNVVFVADIDRVGQTTLSIGEIAVVPQTVDKLAALVAVAEQEAVEGVEAGVALGLAPRSDGLSLVGRIGRSLKVAGVAGRLLGEGNLEDGVIVVHNLIVALADEYVLIGHCQRVGASRDDGVGILHSRLVVVKIVGRALHRAVVARVLLVGTQRVAAGGQGDTGDESLCKLLRAVLDGNAAGRLHIGRCFLQVGDESLLDFLTVDDGEYVVVAQRGRAEGEGHVAEHHHEVVVDHSAQALGLANPLHHLAVLAPLRVVIGVDDEGAGLGGVDELVAVLHQSVGSRPEAKNFATLVVAVEAAVGVVGV